MIYRVGITTGKKGSDTDRVTTEIKLTKGIINRVNLVFPPGCAGLLHVAINHGLHQVWPTNPRGNYATDGETIDFEEFYELKYDPFVLTVYTRNEDDAYEHEVIVRIGLLPRTAFAPWQVGWYEVEEEVVE